MSEGRQPEVFVCGYGCRRESMMPLAEMQKRCFAHNKPFMKEGSWQELRFYRQMTEDL